MITGYATPDDTELYLKKHGCKIHRTPYFSSSIIGIGTHLGAMDEADSLLYQEAIVCALQNGINFIDTAINYRGMRSERDVGIVVNQLIQEKVINREEVIISTKAGLFPGDIKESLHPNDYYEQILLKGGIVSESEVQMVGSARHSLSPKLFEFMLNQSRNHLNLETIDIYFIHRSEISLQMLSKDEFFNQIEKLFTYLEEAVLEGKIRFYGIASWNEFRVEEDAPEYLSLEQLVEIAKKVAGEQHHFRFVQAPLNEKLDELSVLKNQKVNREQLTLIEAANRLGIHVITSAPLHFGEFMSQNRPEELLKNITQTDKIFSTMVGMKRIENVQKNLDMVRIEESKRN